MENSNTPVGNGVPEDKKVVCAVLAFLNLFGIHNFILGETHKGILKLILIIPGAIIAVGPVLAWVLSIIEGVKILQGTYEIDTEAWFKI